MHDSSRNMSIPNFSKHSCVVLSGLASPLSTTQLCFEWRGAAAPFKKSIRPKEKSARSKFGMSHVWMNRVKQ